MAEAKKKRGFFHGASFVGKGFGFIMDHKALWPWAAAPALLTGLVTVLGTWAFYRWATGFVEQQTAGHNWFIAGLLWILLVVFVIGIAFVAFLVTSLIATAPFAGQLSERTEKLATGSAVTQHGLGHIIKEALRSVWHTLITMSMFVTFSVVLFALQFFISPLAPFVWVFGLFVTGTFLAYDAFALPQERRDKSFGDKWGYVGSHKGEALGFGVTVALLMLVPGLGLVVPAVAAVGGTLLYLDMETGPHP
jgi:CysZ protein